MKQWLMRSLLAVAAVFAPAQAMLLTVLVLIIADLCTGLIAAYKRTEPITSSGLRRSIVKLAIYETAIALAFLTEHYLTGPAIPASNIVAGLIGLTELLSIIENLNEISASNLLASVLEKLRQQK